MARKRREVKYVTYTDDDFEERQGTATERNGNLSYIEDSETGEGSYRCPHEIRENW